MVLIVVTNHLKNSSKNSVCCACIILVVVDYLLRLKYQQFIPCIWEGQVRSPLLYILTQNSVNCVGCETWALCHLQVYHWHVHLLYFFPVKRLQFSRWYFPRDIDRTRNRESCLRCCPYRTVQICLCEKSCHHVYILVGKVKHFFININLIMLIKFILVIVVVIVFIITVLWLLLRILLLLPLLFLLLQLYICMYTVGSTATADTSTTLLYFCY